MLISSFTKNLNLRWLTGPIFDKELRVSSRRKRNYVLRFAYLIFLTIFVVLVWNSAVIVYEQSAAYRISRMSEAGKAIITTITVFQFIATQLIAVVMLSTAISDEIYNKTLGVLMTTPISSFQIVMGKLFSKLLQLILLLGISLPILAIIRVFGGVPWNYILSSLCITLTAVIFAGSFSLLFSISARRAYAVILKTIFFLAFLYGFIPVMAAFALRFYLSGPVLTPILIHTNPFAAMQVNTMAMFSPGALRGISFFLWPVHCAVMLCGSALVLAWAVKTVRKVALRQAAGQLNPLNKRGKKNKNLTKQTLQPQESAGVIRPVTGSPVIWKELRAPIIQGGGKRSIIGLIVTIVALLITYAVNLREGLLDEDFAHVAYVLIFVILGLITNIVLSATTITSEKESRCWPILLATSMDDWQILIGKAVGVFRKCLPIWLLLAGHLVLFVSVTYIHPIAIIHMAMLVTWIVVFLSGAGLYFSSRFKRTTSAVVANFGLALTLWVIVPMLLGLVTFAFDNQDILESYISTNPVTQAVVIMNAAAGSRNGSASLSNLNYDWPHYYSGFWKSATGTTAFLFITMLIYMSLGALFAWRAKCRFRKNIF